MIKNSKKPNCSFEQLPKEVLQIFKNIDEIDNLINRIAQTQTPTQI